jgi:hypothetical protein
MVGRSIYAVNFFSELRKTNITKKNIKTKENNMPMVCRYDKILGTFLSKYKFWRAFV